MKKLLSTILAVSLIITATACSTSGADNRETVDNRETKSTVNPDVSEPNQSIPSDAMITETETESTSPVKNGNTYTINGVEFTISVRIEDYLYDLPGSDAKYIDLDKFMKAYGFTSEGKWPEERCSYENIDGICFQLDRKETSFYSNGLGVCSYITVMYPSSYSKNGSIGIISMSSDHSLDEDNHVYVVNGYVENGKLYEKYCVSQELLVVLAVTFETLNETGSTAPAVNILSRACFCRDEGSDDVQRIVIQ